MNDINDVPTKETYRTNADEAVRTIRRFAPELARYFAAPSIPADTVGYDVWKCEAADVLDRLREDVPWLFASVDDECHYTSAVIDVDLADDDEVARFESWFTEPHGSREWHSKRRHIRFNDAAACVVAAYLEKPWEVPFKARVTTTVDRHNRRMLAHALCLGVLGYRVIPAHRPHHVAGSTSALKHYNKALKNGKTQDAVWVADQAGRAKLPVGVDWPARASSDHREIWKNFNEYPAAVYDADGKKTGEKKTRYIDFEVNICMVTGLASGCFALDVDGDQGRESLKRLCVERGELPHTVQSLSGSGKGDHYLFKLPDGVELRNTASKFGSAGKEGTGLDIRSYHGQIILAPSLHKSGREYRWVISPFDTAMTEAPEWVVNEAIACSKKAQQEQGAAHGKASKHSVDDDAEYDDTEYHGAGAALPGGSRNRIAQIGYGEGTAGCIHHAVMSAALSFFFERGSGADAKGLESAIRERIDVVTRNLPDKRNRYFDDTQYVAGRIKEARTWVREQGAPESKPYAFETEEEAREAIEALGESASSGAFDLAVQSVGVSAFSESAKAALAKALARKRQCNVAAVTKDMKDAARKHRAAGQVCESDDLIAEFNERYAVHEARTDVEVLAVDRPPGKLPGQYSEAAFQKLTEALRPVDGVDEHGRQLRAGRVWFNSQDRRVVRAMDFAPPGSEPPPDDTFNLWNGFPRLKDMSNHTDDELKTMCPLFMDYIRQIVANGDAGLNDYLLDWWADIFQRPGRKMGSAIVLVGGFGSGKSTMYEMLWPALGDYVMKVNTAEMMNSNFNEHKACKLLHVSEEANHAGDKAGANRQKDEITSETQLINPKFKAAFTVRDYARKLFLANNAQEVIQITKGDRRYTVCETSDAMSQLREVSEEKQRAFFRPIRHEMRPGGDGLPAFVEFLRRRRYDAEKLGNPYETEAKKRMMRGQLDPAERWIVDCIDGGSFSSNARCADGLAVGVIELEPGKAVVKKHNGAPMIPLPRIEMRAHFDAAIRDAPERFVKAKYGTNEMLEKLLADMLGVDPVAGKSRNGLETVWVWWAPSLADMREKLVKNGYLAKREREAVDVEDAVKVTEERRETIKLIDAIQDKLRDGKLAGGVGLADIDMMNSAVRDLRLVLDGHWLRFVNVYAEEVADVAAG